MTKISVMRDKFARSWPRHEQGEPAYVMELGRALCLAYYSDAHFAAYRTPNGRRLAREAIDAGTLIELTSIVFDLDCPEVHGTSTPAPETWRQELREKVQALASVHPDPYYYETRGGARIVYAQEMPTALRTQEDAKQWSQNYALAVAYLARAFAIAADPSCSDWQRLFRAPRATREAGGKPENWPVLGDPNRIGNLMIKATVEDVSTAKQATTALRKARAFRPSALGVGGDGLFFHALRLRGHVGAQAPRGGWSALCPNRSQHTVNTDWSDATIVVPPNAGHEIGLILCRHAHCWERFTVQQWLRKFSDSELDAARSAAGIPQRRVA